MDEELRNICDLLINDCEILKSFDKDTEIEFALAGASLFVAEGEVPDTEKLSFAKEFKGEKGIFANFSERSQFFIRCKMALADDPVEYFETLVDACMFLKTGKAYTESNNLLASMILVDGADLTDDAAYENTANGVKEIYKEISGGKKGEVTELPFAAIAALEERGGAELVSSEQDAKNFIKSNVRLDNVSLKAVSRVMSLYGEEAAKQCESFCAVSKTLKKAKHSVGQGRVNILLAFATALGISESELVDNIVSADDYIKQYKPFKGIMGVEPEFRRLMAIMCVMKRFDPSDGDLSKIAAVMVIYITVLNATRSF